MVKKKRKIIWNNEAAEHLKEIYEYISTDSVSAARKVKTEILDTIKNLTDHPEIFVADELKENNDGSYRVFYIYSYRVV